MTRLADNQLTKNEDMLLPTTATASSGDKDATGSVMSRGWLALMDQGIISGTNFVTSFLVGRFLGKEELGLYFITVSLFTVLQCVTDQLVHTPYLVRAPHLRGGKKRRFGGSMFLSTLCITAIACLVVGLSGTLFASGIAGQGNIPTGLPTMLIALSLLLPGMMLREFTHNMLHNQLRQGEVVLLDGTVAAVQLVLLSSFLYLQQLTLLSALSIVAFASTFVGVLWLPRMLRAFSFQPRLAALDFANNWPIGKWTLGSYLIGSSAPTVLPWVLAMTHGAVATGLLAACLTLVGIAQTFLRGLGKYMAPQLSVAYAEGGMGSLRSSLRTFTVYSLIAMTAIGGLLFVAGEPLVQFVYGSSYSGTGAVMRTLAVGCWLQTTDVLVGNGLLALALSDRNFWADCGRFGTTVLLAFLLIPALGGLGVALAIVLGMMSGLVIRSTLLLLALRDESAVGEQA